MKNAIRAGMFAAVLGCVLTPVVAPAVQSQSLEEVQVDGQSLSDLRGAVTKAEKKFLALYNKLNKNNKYSVSCRDEANTGSRLAKRTCSSRAEDMAIADQARNFLGAVDMNAAMTSTAAGNAAAAATAVSPAASPTAAAVAAAAPTPAVTGNTSSAAPSDSELAGTIRESRSQFDQNMNELLSRNPDLQQLMDEYLQARKRLETARARQAGKQPG